LVVGGVPGGLIGLPDVEIYDPVANTWTVKASLNIPRYDHAAVVLSNGRVLIIGGTTGAEQISTCEMYYPDWNFWKLSAPLYHRPPVPTVVTLKNGKILVAAGFSYDPPLPTAEIIDPATETTTFAAQMLSDRYNHDGTILPDGRVLLVGGQSLAGGSLSSGGSSDSGQDTPRGARPLSRPRRFPPGSAA